MIRHFNVQHSQGGFELLVSAGPRWSAVIAHLTEGLLAAVGHPCCWQGLGRIEWIGHAAHDLLDGVIDADHRRRRELARIPLTPEAALALGWPQNWFAQDLA